MYTYMYVQILIIFIFDDFLISYNYLFIVLSNLIYLF